MVLHDYSALPRSLRSLVKKACNAHPINIRTAMFRMIPQRYENSNVVR